MYLLLTSDEPGVYRISPAKADVIFYYKEFTQDIKGVTRKGDRREEIHESIKVAASTSKVKEPPIRRSVVSVLPDRPHRDGPLSFERDSSIPSVSDVKHMVNMTSVLFNMFTITKDKKPRRRSLG